VKQVRFESFGPPAHVARCVEVAEPGAPAPWEVLVEVEACCVNPADLARLAGQYGERPRLPAGVGLEAAGRILACGAAVHGLAVGDRVVIVGNDNWVQRRRIAATLVLKAPPGVDALQLAALKVGAVTAVELVRRHGTRRPGDWLVQNAPLSGVGRAVIQVARHDGLRTLNIVRRADAVDAVLALGGDAAVLDDGDPARLREAVRAATGGAPLRCAFDAVGGAAVARLAQALDEGGTIVNYGMLSGQPMLLGCEQTVFRGISLRGFWLSQRLARMPAAPRDALLVEAMTLLACGALRTEVAAAYPLAQVGAALRHAQEPGRRGKVFLLPNGPLHGPQADATDAAAPELHGAA